MSGLQAFEPRHDITRAVPALKLLVLATASQKHAAMPGHIGWGAGDEIIEEVVAIDHAGHGYAAAAQFALSARNEDKGEAMLIGTIDGLNIASRRSAERVGRKRIIDYVFLPLDPPA